MADLLKCRQELDIIDSQILKLFEKRMDICKEVADYKISTGKSVLDTAREQEKIDKIKSMTKNEEYKNQAGDLLKQIMSMSRKLQYARLGSIESVADFEKTDKLPVTESTKVVYFGVEGTHSEQAMINYFGEDVQRYGKPVFSEVMDELKEGKADYGVLPIENSSTGGINDIYNLLGEYDNYIVDEIDLKIDQALLGVKGAKLSDIRKVYSHTQGLMQCSQFLEENPQIAQYSYSSTAASAKKVKEDNDISQAAIAGVIAAKCYGLDVIKKKCNYNSNNTTRFIIVSPRPVYISHSDRISICFEIPHKSGSLYDILSNFIYNNINMTKIESSPIQGKSWEYRFFVDIEGSIDDAAVKNALTGIKAETVYFKILGSYCNVEKLK